MPFGSRMMRVSDVHSLASDEQERRAGTGTHAASARKPVWALVIPAEPSDGGGVNQVVLNLAAELKRQGCYEPVVIVLDWKKAGTVEHNDGVTHLFMRVR